MNHIVELLKHQRDVIELKVKNYRKGLKDAEKQLEEAERALAAIYREFGIADDKNVGSKTHITSSHVLSEPSGASSVMFDFKEYGVWKGAVEHILKTATRKLTTLDVAKEAQRLGAEGTLEEVTASVRYALQALKKNKPMRAILERGHGKHPLWVWGDAPNTSERTNPDLEEMDI